nr:hypothetical protein 1 [Beihai shrimp virus 2]
MTTLIKTTISYSVYEALHFEEDFEHVDFTDDDLPAPLDLSVPKHRLVETPNKAFWTTLPENIVRLLDNAPVKEVLVKKEESFDLPQATMEDMDVTPSDPQQTEDDSEPMEVESFNEEDFWPAMECEEHPQEEMEWDEIEEVAATVSCPIVYIQDGKIKRKRTLIKAFEQGLLSDHFPADFFPTCLKKQPEHPSFDRLEILMNIAADYVHSEQLGILLDNHVELCHHINGWHKSTWRRFTAYWSEIIRTFPAHVDCYDEIMNTYSPSPRTAANIKYCQRKNKEKLDAQFEWLRVVQTVAGIPPIRAEEQVFGIPEMIQSITKASDSVSASGEVASKFMEKCTENIENASKKIDDLSSRFESFIDSEDVDTGSKLWNTIKKAKENAPALIMSVIAITQATDKIQLITHFTNISYLLGLNKIVMDKLYSLFSKTTPQTEEFVDAQEQGDSFTATLKLLGIGASFLGKYSPSQLLTGQSRGLFTAAKEMEAMQQISDLVLGALEEWGIYDSEKSKVIRQLRESLKLAVENIAEYETMMTTKPVAFLRNVYYSRFCEDFNRVEVIKTQIATSTYKELSGSNFNAEVMSLTTRYKEVKRVVDKTRACSGKRPTPVGVAFMGAAGIGKSFLQTNMKTLLAKRFKERNLENDPRWEGLIDLPTWQVWNQNTKDQYHEGYVGQEIHNVDDMFQSAEQEDHLDYINMISCNVFPTRQAEISNKGTPYKSRLVVGSCNHFPQTSKTINAIDALQRRFAVVEVTLNGAMPTDFDPLFSHLRFKVWRDGRDFAAEQMGGMPMSENMSLVQLLDYLLEAMKVADDIYDATINAEFQLTRYESDPVWEVKTASVEEVKRIKDRLIPRLNNDWSGVLALADTRKARALRTQRMRIDGEEKIVTELAQQFPVWRKTSQVLRHVPNVIYVGWEQALGDCWVQDDEDFVAVEWSSASTGTVWVADVATFMNAMDEEEFQETVYDPWYYRILKGVQTVLSTALKYLYKAATLYNSVFVDPVVDAIISFLTYVFELDWEDPFTVSMFWIIRFEVSFVIAQVVTVVIGLIWFSIRAMALRSTETCESCKNPERDTFNRKLLCGYCTNHCKIGYFYTTHTDECKLLSSAVKEIEAATCDKCINGFCDRECPHVIVREEGADARKVSMYLDAVSEVYGDVKCESEIMKLKESSAFFDEIVAYESSSESRRRQPRRKVNLESRHCFYSRRTRPHMTVNLESSSESRKTRPRMSVNFESSSESRTTRPRRQVQVEVDEAGYQDLKKDPVVEETSAYRADATRQKIVHTFEESLRKENVQLEGGVQAVEEMARDEAGMKTHAKIANSTVQIWAMKKSKEGEQIVMKIHGVAFGHHVLIPRHLTFDRALSYYMIDSRVQALPAEVQNIIKQRKMFCTKKVGSNLEVRSAEKFAVLQSDTLVPITFVGAAAKHDYALWSFSRSTPAFPDTFYKNLITQHDLLHMSQHIHTGVQYLPLNGLSYIVQINLERDLVFKLSETDFKTYDQIWQVRALHLLGAQTSAGDCGGAITCLDTNLVNKVIGFHVLGAKQASYGAIVTKEGVDTLLALEAKQEKRNVQEASPEGVEYDLIEQNVSLFEILDPLFNVPFDSDGDLCPDGEIYPIGNTPGYYREAGKTMIKRHTLAGAFPDTMRPAPVHPSQVADQSKLMENHKGNADILFTQYAKYATPEPVVPGLDEHLADMVGQLTQRYIDILSPYDTSFASEDEAINGVKGNVDSHPLDVRTSPGVPWTDVIPGSKKIHFLDSWTDETDGNIRFIIADTHEGNLLRKAINEKRALGRQGYRTASLWKNCLKDETRPIEKCEVGKTRLFTAAPFETVYLFRECFSKFKTAWTQERNNLFHSVGINPMSVEWTELYRRMAAMSPYGNDADFGRYDGCLRSDFMRAAGKVVTQSMTVMNNLDEEQQLLMEVLWEEIVTTLQVSRNEVSITSHGNPSGNPMTTVVNCIVNLMYHWYAYRRITGMTSLESFEQHVFFTCFGDDVVFVSNGYENGYLFEAVAEIMEELGQEYTTASKDAASTGGEKPIDQLQFLKRGFKEETSALVLAPLAQESIEQQFNWTMMLPTEFEGINAQIEEASIEASLHGTEYYEFFRESLVKKILSLGLRRYINLPVNYTDARLLLIRRINETTIVSTRKIRNN